MASETRESRCVPSGRDDFVTRLFSNDRSNGADSKKVLSCFCYQQRVKIDRSGVRPRMGHAALSPPLHAFSRETPDAIINSSLFRDRL
ncbi:hypothetical protein EVAR_48719_1 [Eumeta japonica]|uniref:Uncharacterized protein n=1 Tax=Eumeta variegata TaxID=151549 RepID=A0A4C1XEP8_EUMVA|nr:hypothetical protein EVAR_48719_1 [Eumeta japonica]